MKNRSAFLIGFLVIGSVLGSIVAIEIGLQILGRPNKTVGWEGGAVHSNEVNELRHRGQKVEYGDNDHVVVLVGDSQVHAAQTAFGWMPEKRLQHHLRKRLKKPVKVFTVAAAGWGTDQELLALKEYYNKFRADDVVLWFTPGNDIWNNQFPTPDPIGKTLKPTFWLENGELKGPSHGWKEHHTPYGLRLAVFMDRFGWLENPDKDWLEKHLPPPYEPMKSFDGKALDDWETRRKENPEFANWERVDIEKAHLAIELTPRSKRMEYGVELTRKLLGEIRSLVESKGGKFRVILTNKMGEIPSPEEAEKSGEVVHLYQGKYYKTSKKQELANLKDVFRDVRWDIIQIDTPDPEVGPSDSHLNQHANDEAMEKLSRLF